MKKIEQAILTDTLGRQHSYLRISLTERCNLRCTYCMPAEGIELTPRAHLMTADEIFEIAKTFVAHGVTKIRLTGGEPLVRKDFPEILERLASLPVSLAITTNGVLVPRFLELLKKHQVAITISIDSLQEQKFNQITRRNYFRNVWDAIQMLIEQEMVVKLNIVLIKDFNDSEIADFIALTKKQPLIIRFIEFMPFDGNRWDKTQLVSQEEILDHILISYSKTELVRLQDAPNDTARNYKLKDYKGQFAIISSVTNPFCDSCNRIRLTADGKLKNCLFSSSETSLLETFRSGASIIPLIKKAVGKKHAARGGMDTFEKLNDPILHSRNRSMIKIGG